MTDFSHAAPKSFRNAAPRPRPRIFLVDDHVMIRVGLRNFIELNSSWEICGEAAMAADVLAKEIEESLGKLN